MKKRSHNILSTKKKNRRFFDKKKILWTAGIIVVLFLIIGAGFLVSYSKALAVKEIQIEGVRLLEKDDVLKTIESEIMQTSSVARMLGSDRILFWTLNEGPLVLKNSPVIDSLDIDAHIFSRTVQIVVDEREAVAVLCTIEEVCFAMNKEGIPFKKSANVSGGLVLKIYDEGEWGIVLGKPFFENVEWMENLFATLHEMKESGFVPSEVYLYEKQTEEWEAVMPSGLSFIYSLQFVPEDLSNILNRLNEDIRMDSIDHFDFRIQNRVFYR